MEWHEEKMINPSRASADRKRIESLAKNTGCARLRTLDDETYAKDDEPLPARRPLPVPGRTPARGHRTKIIRGHVGEQDPPAARDADASASRNARKFHLRVPPSSSS